MADTPLRPAPIVPRLVASIIDFSIVMVLVLIIENAWTTEGGAGREPASAATWLSLGAVVVYFVASHAVVGQTLGKKLARTAVVTTADAPIGWLRSIIRFVVAFGPILALGPVLANMDDGSTAHGLVAYLQVLIPALVYVPVIWRTDRRGLHDLAAGTLVKSLMPPLRDLLPSPEEVNRRFPPKS